MMKALDVENDGKRAERLRELWIVNSDAHVQFPHNLLIFANELRLQPADQIILANLMSYARSEGQWVWPSAETLAAHMNCTVNALRKRLRRMHKDGLILHRMNGEREEWCLQPLFQAVRKLAEENPERSHEGFTCLPVELLRSWMQPEFVAGDELLSANLCHMLLVLLSFEHIQDYAGVTQTPCISYNGMARRGGLSLRTVKYAVETLEDLGLVQIERVDRLRSNGDERGDAGRNGYRFVGLRLALRDYLDTQRNAQQTDRTIMGELPNVLCSAKVA